MIQKLQELFNKHRKLIIQFVTFGCVGVMNTATDFGVFWLINRVFAVEKSDVATSVANFIAYGCGMACSFVLNRALTFRDKRAVTGATLGRFIAVNLISLSAATLCLLALKNTGMHVFVAKGFSAVISLVLNFIGNRRFVFNRRDKEKIE